MIYLTMAASLIMTDSANNGGGGAVCAQERDEIQSITCSRCRHNPIAAYTRHSVLHQTAAARGSPQLVLTQQQSWKQRSAKFSQCPEEALVEHSSQGSKLKGHLNIASRQIFEAGLNVKALVGSFNVTKNLRGPSFPALLSTPVPVQLSTHQLPTAVLLLLLRIK